MKAFDVIKIVKRPGKLNSYGEKLVHSVHSFAKSNNIPIVDEVTIERALYVSIGGDGTMLGAMDESAKQNYSVDHTATSVIGFNAGNLGFLTEQPRYTPAFMLQQIYDGTDWVKPVDRAVIETFLNDRPHYAINEFTFTPRSISEMMTCQVDINEHFVTEYAGSGVLISTATGSTAMAMSAGGAIISPSTDIMQIAPLMPHSLTVRPIITSSSDKITVMSEMERIPEVQVHCDGRLLTTFKDEAYLTVKKAKYPVRVWYNSEYDFFQVLSHKLDW